MVHVRNESRSAPSAARGAVRALRGALLAGFAAFAIAAAALVYTYLKSKDALLESTREDLVALGSFAARQIDGDAHARIAGSGRTGDETYHAAIAPLLRLRAAVPELYYAYTLSPASNGLRFTLDTTYYVKNPGDDSPAAELGELYDDAPPAAHQALATSTPVSAGPYSDKWGVFLSAFVPISASDGRTVGILGIDISLARMNGRLAPLRVAVALALAGSALLSVLVGVSRYRALRDSGLAAEENARALRLAEQAAAAAESSNRAKSAFLATLSHEIRTPMNGVLGMTGIVLETSLTPHQRECLETVRGSGEALLAILNDILDYSKIEAGRLELELRPFALREVAEDALDLFAAEAQKKNIELALLVEKDVPETVVGDSNRLRQILLNLVGNAIKFTRRGEITVEIRAGGVRADRRLEIEFAVKDTGVGIPADRLDRLFKPFSQVDSSTTRTHGGTGLGLAISRRLATVMGGDIRVQSRQGEGSTFTLSILAEPRPADETSAAPAAEALRDRDLLIVDDHEVNRRLVSEHALRWGMRPVPAASAEDALRFLQTQKFDLAVIDMHMPDSDGLRLAHAIRAMPAHATLPLVLYTSIGEHPPAGIFASVIPKPIKPALLHAELQRALSTATSREAAPNAAAAFEELAKLHPLSILMAEDNNVNQRVSDLHLRRLGYRAELASDGAEAVAAWKRLRSDLILMDVQMPGIDGREATRRIRAASGDPRRPWIVALTADAMPSDREAALASGMNDYLSKPLRPEALAAALVRAHRELRAAAG